MTLFSRITATIAIGDKRYNRMQKRSDRNE